VALVGGIGVEAVVLGVPGWWCRRGPVDLLGRWPGRRLAGRCEVRAGVM